ncbi:MAG: RHS repeat-associated protein [Arenicella sp.]|jgi:RHS repeat-associated protein
MLSDNLGSTNVIINKFGKVEQRLEFDPWGMRTTASPLLSGEIIENDSVNDVTTRGYTGHEMDDEVGLINMNARIYDPYLGRFLSADPVLPDAGDMQQFNRYSYVTNNPLKFTDPTGNNGVTTYAFNRSILFRFWLFWLF